MTLRDKIWEIIKEQEIVSVCMGFRAFGSEIVSCDHFKIDGIWQDQENGWYKLEDYPIMKFYIETSNKASHGLCPACQEHYEKDLGCRL